VDPFDYNRKFPIAVNKLLHEISFSIIYSIYMVVLFIWYTLAENIYLRSSKNLLNKGLPKCIMGFKHVGCLEQFGLPKAVMFYSLQVVSSALKNYKKSEFLLFLEYTHYVLAGFLGMLFLGGLS